MNATEAVFMLRTAIEKHRDPAWECNSDHPALLAALDATSAIAPPVAAGSVDTLRLQQLMTRINLSAGCDGIAKAKKELIIYINAWGAQQREAGKQEALDLTVSIGQLRQRAEKAEADLKARDFFVAVLNCQVKKAQGEADVLFHRLNAANGHLTMARERIEELETEIKVQHRG